MTSNIFLDSILFKFCDERLFLGTFSADTLPNYKLCINKHLISNYSKKHEAGTHFIAMSISKNKVFIFDPYGQPMMNPIILNHFPAKLKFLHSKHVIQSDSSISCGLFCIGYILSKRLKITFNDFISIFNRGNNLDQNDIIIGKFIVKCIQYLKRNNRKKVIKMKNKKS
jgi:hypothetical protein